MQRYKAQSKRKYSDESTCPFRNKYWRKHPGSFYAHSKADFIAKLQIALKECSESEYWLELLIESGYHGDKAILDRCVEIKRILISSINTAKENTQK